MKVGGSGNNEIFVGIVIMSAMCGPFQKKHLARVNSHHEETDEPFPPENKNQSEKISPNKSGREGGGVTRGGSRGAGAGKRFRCADADADEMRLTLSPPPPDPSLYYSAQRRGIDFAVASSPPSLASACVPHLEKTKPPLFTPRVGVVHLA